MTKSSGTKHSTAQEEHTSKLLTSQPHTAADMSDDNTIDTPKHNATDRQVWVPAFAQRTVAKLPPVLQNARTVDASSVASCEETRILIDAGEDDDDAVFSRQPFSPLLPAVSTPTALPARFDTEQNSGTKPSNLISKSDCRRSVLEACKLPPSQKTDDAAGEGEGGCGRDESCGERVVFLVGEERQPMTGMKSQLAAISPVFAAQFSARWQASGGEGRERRQAENIPDVDASAFAQILRFSQGEAPQLKEEGVWQTLLTADRYDVQAVVDQCFTFLLHHHSRRHRTRHICTVLELAHSLNRTSRHHECMETLKKIVLRVFRNKRALTELCQQCMLRLISSPDLSLPEISIHDAVVTWAYCACAKRGVMAPSLGMLREVAGDLKYHVRYLLMPQRTLKSLANRAGQISCLLTQTELNDLLNGDARHFPDTVSSARQTEQRSIVSSLCCRQKQPGDSTLSVLFLCFLTLLFVVAVLYAPIMYAVKSSQGD